MSRPEKTDHMARSESDLGMTSGLRTPQDNRTRTTSSLILTSFAIHSIYQSCLQSCYMVKDLFRNTFQRNFYEFQTFFIQWDISENMFCKMFCYFMEGPVCLCGCLHEAQWWTPMTILSAWLVFCMTKQPGSSFLNQDYRKAAWGLGPWISNYTHVKHWDVIIIHALTVFLCYIAIRKSQICGDIGLYSQNDWGQSWFQCAKCPQNAASA